MANPDSGNLPSALGNSPPKFRRRPSAPEPPFNERTANWPGLPGKAGSDRSAGIKKVRTHPKSVGV